MAVTETRPIGTPTIQTRTAVNLTAAKAEWLAERRTYVGATDVAAILGVHPYTSAHDVWLDKKGLKDDESNVPMRLGVHIEGFIAKEYQNLTGGKVRKSRLYRHAKYGFCACNPDRDIVLTHEGHTYKGLLECKSVGHWASKNFGQDGSDQIPEHYLVQVMWQLIITRADFVHLAALIDNRELRIFTYTLHPELSGIAHVFPQDTVRSAFTRVVKWWQCHVEGDVEPPLSGHDSDTEWMQDRRKGYDNGVKVLTDDETDRECVLLRRSTKRKERADFVVAERKNRIKAYMAQHGASELDSSVGPFTYKLNVKGVASFKTPFTTSNA